MKTLITILFTTVLIQVSHQGFGQEIPCKQWYFITDRNGNQTKATCKEGWFENDIGQKHGKYFLNNEDGTASVRATYKNGELNGKYISYSGSAVADSGRYINGVRNRRWFFAPDYFVTYVNGKATGKSKHKVDSYLLEGTLNSNGQFSGRMMLGYGGRDTKNISGNEFRIFPFPDFDCENALNLSERSKQFISLIQKATTNKINRFDDLGRIVLVCDILNGDLINFEKTILLVGEVETSDVIKSQVLELKILNKEHPESNFYNEMTTKANSQLDPTFLQAYLAKYPTGMYVDKVKSEIEILKDKINAKDKNGKFSLVSISFKIDSYEVDERGEIALKALVGYLEKMAASGMEHLLLIGHAGADKKLNKTSFDPSNLDRLTDNNGSETSYTEHDLAILRFALTIGRIKTIYRSIKHIKPFDDLSNANGFWMLPVGTMKGDQIASNNGNQNIVQLVFITKDGRELNTEASALPWGSTFNTPYLDELNWYIGHKLGFSFNKLLPEVLGHRNFGTPIPDYIELATNPNSFASWCNLYR